MDFPITPRVQGDYVQRTVGYKVAVQSGMTQGIAEYLLGGLAD